jgi:hypothetical protein
VPEIWRIPKEIMPRHASPAKPMTRLRRIEFPPKRRAHSGAFDDPFGQNLGGVFAPDFFERLTVKNGFVRARKV